MTRIQKNCLLSLLVTLVHFAFRLRFSLLLIAFTAFLTSSLTLSTLYFLQFFTIYSSMLYIFVTWLWKGGGVCVLKFVECYFAVIAVL